MLDNAALIAPFVPQKDDGEHFIYTELIDRSKTKGNNGHRQLRMYYHRSRQEFDEQMPEIRRFCDAMNIRAYTHLCKRSWTKVGKEFAVKVVEAAVSDNHAGMKSLYQHTLRVVTPVEKLWMWDIDEISPLTLSIQNRLHEAGVYRATIPSRKGLHYISDAFDLRVLGWAPVPKDGHVMANVQIHKYGPTNLYIPDGAA